MTSLLEDAVDIPAWLEADRASGFDVRVHRDRAHGLAIAETRTVSRVRSWWRRIEIDDRPRLGTDFARARRWISLLLVIVGAVLGAGLALAVLQYDGRYPVNVVSALALLVGLPLVLMLATVALLPGRLPVIGGLQDMLAAINLGNLATAVFDRIAKGDGALKLGWHPARSGAAGRFARWQLVAWSQLAGLSFCLAATTTAFALVVFTDLAFGWSTTLAVSADEAERIARAIALPWAQWNTDAVPDHALVQTSRFFRLESAEGVEVGAGELTGWWPFLLMALLVYGVLPRCVLLVVARGGLNAATRGLLLDDAGVRALLDRMNTAHIDVHSDAPVEAVPPELSDAAPKVPPQYAQTVRVIVWNLEDVESWLASHVGNIHGKVLHAGERGLDDDRDTIAALDANDRTMVLVLTKAWEPPMLDCLDFLGALRERLEGEVSIVVAPIGIDGAAPTTVDVAAWRHAVVGLGDAATYVEAAT